MDYSKARFERHLSHNMDIDGKTMAWIGINQVHPQLLKPPEVVFTNKEKVQKEVKAALTQNATLSCEVAQEKTDVKWYKEGKLITSSKKFKVESEGKSRRLVVNQLEKKDAGEYTCEAAGQKLNFKIVVTGERRHFGPSFLFLEHLQKLLLFCKCFSSDTSNFWRMSWG
uniref:Ig-like domain-containing protein n=1 Tax=Anas platyrhynchos platyrhynchos TaxID=8840 RepID=A0A493TM79_ANAPP